MSLEEQAQKIDALLARLEKAEQRNVDYGKHILQLHEQVASLCIDKGSKTSKEDEIKIQELPDFDGDTDPASYLDWERKIERIFTHKKADDKKRFSYAILKLSKYASLWYESMQTKRTMDKKEQLDSWEDLKAKMRKRFIPRSYKQQLFNRYNSLQQESLSVDQYIKEFERLYMACDCHELEEQKISKFITGLNPHIGFQVEMQQYCTFDDVCLLATKVEQYFHEKKHKPFRYSVQQKAESSTSSQQESVVDLNSKSKEENVAASLKFKHDKEKETQGQAHMRKVVCFKCQGQGHLSKNCPNKILISREEHYLLLHQREEEEKQRALEESKEQEHYADPVDALFKNIPLIPPEPDHNTLLLHEKIYESSPSSPSSETSQFKVGDFVWIDDNALDKYMGQYSMPVAEGPYRIVKTVGKDRFKLMLGRGLQGTFKDTDLLPCSEDAT